MSEAIYQLDMYEEIKVAGDLYARHVPGGWIFSDTTVDDTIGCCFVPCDKEFYKLDKEDK